MRRILFLACLLLFFACSSCEDGKEDYSGLSELVAQRQKARKALAGKTSDPSDSKSVTQTTKPGTGDKKEDRRSGSLYKKEVEIIDAISGTPLGKGIAYLDKEGDIIKIKIKKE